MNVGEDGVAHFTRSRVPGGAQREAPTPAMQEGGSLFETLLEGIPLTELVVVLVLLAGIMWAVGFRWLGKSGTDRKQK